MEVSDKDGLSRGYGAVLWPQDDRTVRQPRIIRLMRTAWTDPAGTAIAFGSERARRGHLTLAELAGQIARVALSYFQKPLRHNEVAESSRCFRAGSKQK